ncbi:MAG TPA: tRNA dihydrouridine synthase DusB [Bacillota bacterium]|nr:tRNA dihydrouridine synthase DusB [Bacillota bacterium]HUM56102.1 tRNA dihydrouridine synthase DusB [Bacillota bacterium]
MPSIGNIELENPFFFAPMAGISDAPTRSLARSMGAALVYSEMVSGKGLLYNSKKTERLLNIYPEEKPLAFQIFGAEPLVIEETARILSKRDNVILDINMGCPVSKVIKNNEGCALMKDPSLAGKIVEAAVKGTKKGLSEEAHSAKGNPVPGEKPVTVKIRAGWDSEHINAVEVALAAQEAGAMAVAVHGRTRQQYYGGKADREIITRVKDALVIPVIGSGDIFSGEDANEMMEETGCDFVMIARGALGNPWIFKEASALWQGKSVPPGPSTEEKKAMIIKHLEMLEKEKGERTAVREMRKHVGWYLKGERGVAAIRCKVNEAVTVTELKQIVENLV